MAKQSIIKDIPELELKMECSVCKKKYPLDKNLHIHFVRIQRGHFIFAIEDNEIGGVKEKDSNIKAELWLCEDCYLKDPDLCRFFNKIGWRIR